MDSITLTRFPVPLIPNTLLHAGNVECNGIPRTHSNIPYGAAVRLGIKRTTLIARMKKHGIFRPAEDVSLNQAIHSDYSVAERR
jgi:hypothetical protein